MNDESNNDFAKTLAFEVAHRSVGCCVGMTVGTVIGAAAGLIGGHSEITASGNTGGGADAALMVYTFVGAGFGMQIGAVTGAILGLSPAFYAYNNIVKPAAKMTKEGLESICYQALT